MCNGFDYGELSPGELMDCGVGDIPDPALHQCVVNEWQCGYGFDSLGKLESCGTCDDPGTTCVDNMCVLLDAGVDSGI